VASPSFLTIHPNRRFLYAAAEVDSFEGQEKAAGSSPLDRPGVGDLTKLINNRPAAVRRVMCRATIGKVSLCRQLQWRERRRL